MRSTGPHSTMNAMEIGTGLMAVAFGRALQDGMARAQALADEDRGHQVGAQRYNAIVRNKKIAMRNTSIAAAERLVANRKKIHG